MRVRLLHELVLHKDTYLNNDFLSRGCVQDCQKHFIKIYAQYSDMYVPGMLLDERTIEFIFKMETLKIRLDKSFMGIWQIHALSSVLNTPVFSIYPKLGNPRVRLDLNRVVLPRNYSNSEINPVYIFWTSTRSDMNSQHWIPNHFVPVVPIDDLGNDKKGIHAESQQDVDTDHAKDIIKTGEKVETTSDISMTEELVLDQEQTKMNQCNQNGYIEGEDELVKDQEENEHKDDSQRADKQKNILEAKIHEETENQNEEFNTDRRKHSERERPDTKKYRM
jgi:hypothetical protein